MTEPPRLIPRHAEAIVAEALTDTRVVLVNGARQSGKSTLTRVVASRHERAAIWLLDDPATMRAAKDDPTSFVDHEGLMVIDEIQLLPELVRPIKVVVDLDPRPGRFLLTGSSRVLALRNLPDALPGRMEVIELWPFSQGEISGEPDRFVDAAFQHGPRLEHSSMLRRRDYLDRVVIGGFPEAVRRTPRRRAAFFDSYLSTLIERDVLELATIERRGDLFKLLALLAGRAGGLLVPAALTGPSGIPRTTLIRYLDRLPHQEYSGMVVGIDAASRRPGGSAGPMTENFMTMELARQLTWSEERGRLYHYRTKDKLEVDAVIETPDGRVIGIDVKSGATVRTEDLAGLRNLAHLLGDRFVAGYVLYTGQQALSFGEKIRALPLDALWRLAP